MKRSTIELLVEFFVMLAMLSFALLAFQVSGLKMIWATQKNYIVKAAFDNIGGLKVRAPVTISGVKVGEVKAIDLDPHIF